MKIVNQEYFTQIAMSLKGPEVCKLSVAYAYAVPVTEFKDVCHGQVSI